MEAVVVVVEGDDVGVASAEPEAGVSLPGRVEPVDPVQLDGADGVDEVAELVDLLTTVAAEVPTAAVAS